MFLLNSPLSSSFTTSTDSTEDSMPGWNSWDSSTFTVEYSLYSNDDSYSIYKTPFESGIGLFSYEYSQCNS